MIITHRVHGIRFNRSGECNRCKGEPAPLCNCDAQGVVEGPNGLCPHLTRVANKNTCSIYTTRYLHCETCFPDDPEMTHQVCIDFPDHPWLKVIQDGVCSYTFTRVDENGDEDGTPLPFT